MRTAFAVTLVFTLSLAAVRATETPEPVPASDTAPVAERTPNSPAESFSNLTEPAVSPSIPGTRIEVDAVDAQNQPRIAKISPPNDGSKLCVMLKAESFEIKARKSKSPEIAAQVAFLVCDNVTTSSTVGGANSLKCTNCELTLPGGISATASDVVFDSNSNTLTLTGSDESPVTIKVAGTESKAAKLEMKIDPKSWAKPASSQSAKQQGALSDPPRYHSQASY